MDSPLDQAPNRSIQRVIYVFGCNTRECTESGDGSAFRVIIQGVPVAPKTLISESSSSAEKEETSDKCLWDRMMGSDMTDLKSKFENLDCVDSSVKGHFSQHFPVAFPPIALHIVEEIVCRGNQRMPVGDKPTNEDELNKAGLEDGWSNELYEKMLVTGYDKTFKKFHDRVAHYPNQCVRYSPGGEPLYYNSDPLPSLPCCNSCNKPLSFELQLMPAILSKFPKDGDEYLKHIPSSKRGSHQFFEDGMEWGTIMVYSCFSCLSNASSHSSDFSMEGYALAQVEK